MENKTDIYDVKQYTDRELYSILIVSSPTDRELEAKIHFFINKYERVLSDEGTRLIRFFRDIYAHFFELEEEESNEPVLEGFDISFSGLSKGDDVSNVIYGSPDDPKIKRDAPIDKNDPNQKAGINRDISFSIASAPGTTDTKQTAQIGLVKSLDYSKGSINPLLKQTIKRIICIDSQFRDKRTYPYSSDFTFNLSDTMTDVVSLKLYSVQIPYTWYTINNSYGSNFFYIKGNAPGIDTGNSEYKFEIKAGSYTSNELTNKIRTSISEAKLKTTDISFGTTNIEYDPNSSRTSITLDLNKTFLDIDFEIYFPSWTPPKNNDGNIAGNRFETIPGYLGYNSQALRSYNVYSYNVISNTKTYQMTSDNNYFTISIYNGPETYNPQKKIKDYKYELNNQGYFKRVTIVNQIQNAFDNGNIELRGSTITYDETKNYVKMNITLDRNKIAFIKNMKAVILFPNDTIIWTGQTSCFQFDISINELNNIISEIDPPTTLRTVTKNPWIYLKCNKENYGNKGIKTYANNDSYVNRETTLNATHILSDFSYITTIDRTFTITGDEYTILNKSLYIQNGNISLSGSNYKAYGSNIFVINTNNTIPAIINGNTIVYGNTVFNATGPFTISGERYLYNGNAMIQGNTSIIGQGNITNFESTYYEVNSNNTYQVCGISGNSNVLGKLTTGANISLYTDNNVRLNGALYKMTGDAFISGNTEFINGSTKIRPVGNCLVSGNYSYSGNTQLRAGTISISRGNIQIKVPPNEGISNYKINTFPSVFNLDTFTQYTNYNDISGNIYITGVNYNIEIRGNVIINTSDPSNSSLPINTWFEGNSTVYGEDVNILGGTTYNSLPATYKIDGSSYQILESGNIYGNTTIIKGNINIINNQSFDINGTSYKVKGNINNATGNITLTDPANIYGNIWVIGDSYILNGNTDIRGKIQGTSSGGNISIYGNTISGNTYNIDGPGYYFLNKTKILGNINVLSGNLTIESDTSYNISGNTYSLINHNQAILSGNIFTLSGHSIIQGNSYSVKPITGNIRVYNDISVNDYIIDISNQSTSSLSEYINNIQGNISQKTNLYNSQKSLNGNITLSIDSSAIPTLYLNYNKKVSPDNYKIDLSKFYQFINLHLNERPITDISNIQLDSSINVITGDFTNLSTYTVNESNNKIKIKSIGSVNQNVPDLDLTLTSGSYKTSDLFVEGINELFRNNPTNHNIDVRETKMIINQNINNFINFTFNININCELSDADYTLYLYNEYIIQNRQPILQMPKYYDYINNQEWRDSSTNHWNKELGFDENRYILSENQVNSLLLGESSYIYGKISLLNNTITLDDSNNFFYIRPISKPDGIAIDSSGNATYITTIVLNNGIYNKESLTIEINNAFSLDVNDIVKGSKLSFITYNNKSYSSIQLNVNKTFTTKDFKLVFYDLYSFVYCNVGVSGKSSQRNGTWDSTLGWILGFRVNTIYPLSSYIESNTNTVTIEGDTCMSVYLYNYFMIILDDYVQNHLNDGLVTITTPDTGIPLPSYANLTTLKCNPVTNQITTSSSGLTANQIYSANQLLNNKQGQQKSYISPGPFIQDIFGLIPIKVSGMSAGQPYIEFGGSLQLQERSYFGPVNIRRMRIQLMNDKGDMVDLNGADWSFSLVCEQLYSNAFSNSNTK